MYFNFPNDHPLEKLIPEAVQFPWNGGVSSTLNRNWITQIWVQFRAIPIGKRYPLDPRHIDMAALGSIFPDIFRRSEGGYATQPLLPRTPMSERKFMRIPRVNRLLSGIAILLCAVATGTAAAPTIGSVTAGSSSTEYVVSGTGFGTKSKPGPAVYDKVSNISAYGSIVSGATVPTGSSYPWADNTFNWPDSVKFSSKYPRYGGAPYHFRTSNYRGYLQWPNALGGSHGAPASQRKIYVSFWFRPDASIDGTDHSSKFFRIWDEFNGNGTRVSWTQMHLSYDGYSPTLTNWGNWKGGTSTWNRLELWIDADRTFVKTWTNGTLTHNVTDMVKSTAYTDLGLQVARVGWDAGGTNPPEVDSSFGEIYVDTTPARVEVCDKPTWSECTHKELQIAKSWSDTKVAFQLDRGSFPSSTRLYAFIVDGSGSASPTGVALGESEPAPMPPAGVTVE